MSSIAHPPLGTASASRLRPRPVLRPLHELAAALHLRVLGELRDVSASGVASRTADLEAGDVFAALPGARTHGARFAQEARRRGAVAVLTDRAGEADAQDVGLPVLVAQDPRAALGDVAAWLYRTAERMPLLLAVTGTNGKTTTVHLLEHLLERLGTPAGVSSTAERGFEGQHVPSRLTTPEADELHALLARMSEQGVRAAAVEVSAQALVRSRVRGLRFQVAGFTNLTHDHLDDFGTMDAYFAAKAALFAEDMTERAVICVDSPYGRRLARSVRIPSTTVSSVPGLGADWHVANVEPMAGGTRFSLHGPGGEHLVSSIDAIGAHQAVDAALAILMAQAAGYPFNRIARVLEPSGLRMSVHGRLEHVPGSADPAVYLDVGHTPDSMRKGLEALRTVTTGRLVVVFGADGDRDPSKRQPMGRIAGDLADIVVVHDHHSRFEDPDRIRRAVLDGARATGADVFDVPDPVGAIRTAIDAAGPDGTVLWAGTGRTDYRDIGGTKHPFSFWDEAGRAVRRQGVADGALTMSG